MPTESRNGNTYPELARIIEKWANMAQTIKAPVVVASQLKGFEPGKLVVLDSLSFPAYVPKTSRRHPKRPIKMTKNQLERGEFDHLKKGRIYKVSLNQNLPRYQVRPIYLYKGSNLMQENRIGTVQAGSTVIYLETVHAGHGLFHKLVVDDQVGYVHCSHNEFRLKRITSRMLRRMEANVKESNDECETEEP